MANEEQEVKAPIVPEILAVDFSGVEDDVITDIAVAVGIVPDDKATEEIQNEVAVELEKILHLKIRKEKIRKAKRLAMKDFSSEDQRKFKSVN